MGEKIGGGGGGEAGESRTENIYILNKPQGSH